MKKLLILLIAVFLTACATKSASVKQDQQALKLYKCSGIKSWHDCKQAAMRACPAGYDIKYELENITIQRREFEVACKS